MIILVALKQGRQHNATIWGIIIICSAKDINRFHHNINSLHPPIINAAFLFQEIQLSFLYFSILQLCVLVCLSNPLLVNRATFATKRDTDFCQRARIRQIGFGVLFIFYLHQGLFHRPIQLKIEDVNYQLDNKTSFALASSILSSRKILITQHSQLSTVNSQLTQTVSIKLFWTLLKIKIPKASTTSMKTKL